MTLLLNLFILIPIVGFLISLLVPERKEGLISTTAFLTATFQFVSFVIFFFVWLLNDHPVLNMKELVLFKTDGYEFFIDFYFDKVTAVYLFVGALLTSMVTVYSRTYLHREIGYKRFFNTILFFFLGYNIVIFAGNFETLFVGWEVLGISSFLLIAFYRDRYIPVKNAMKVFSIYRIGDVGILVAMWLSHHLWDENITFLKLHNYELVHTHLQHHTMIGVAISLMILLAAAAKSAQLPFSSWLPRAMEGPTPSSAIFYGSLSVHIGVFILLRTYNFWEHQLVVRVLIGLLGLLTSIIATGIARVQSSVKSQIAYSSVSQIGLIFIEVAAGWENLALIHFAGNAFLRTYQLLVSPSVVTYLIREQFYNYTPKEHSVEDSLPKKIEYTLYMLCLKEWNLDMLMYRYLWTPLKKAGSLLKVIPMAVYWIGSFIVFSGGVALLMKMRYSSHDSELVPLLFSALGLIMVLRSFSERRNVWLAWGLIVINHFWIALSISYNEYFTMEQASMYLGGIVVAGIFGFAVLGFLRKRTSHVDLNSFHGHALSHPFIAFSFLLACLAVAGFPVTPTFIGEDLIFSHIHQDQPLLAFLTALSFIVDGLAVIRIYARLFLGSQAPGGANITYRSA